MKQHDEKPTRPNKWTWNRQSTWKRIQSKIVKMIQNLGNKMESEINRMRHVWRRYKKCLMRIQEEIKNRSSAINDTITKLKNSVQSLSCVRFFVMPWTAAWQASLSITNSWSLLKPMSIKSVMPSNHLILCHPLCSCLQSFPASGSFPMSLLFVSGEQSIGVSASTSVLPMNIQDWFPLGLMVWSPCSWRDSQESSATPQFQSINYLVLGFLYGPTLNPCVTYLLHFHFSVCRRVELRIRWDEGWMCLYCGDIQYWVFQFGEKGGGVSTGRINLKCNLSECAEFFFFTTPCVYIMHSCFNRDWLYGL